MTKTQKTLLTGDIGGTNVRFTTIRCRGQALEASEIWKRPGADYPTFSEALQAYLAEFPSAFDGAGFGVAGPVIDNRVQLLHRNWVVDASEISGIIGGGPVLLVNDFEALARSAPDLDANSLETISEGAKDPQGNLAVAGPGTGLGVAILRRLLRSKATGDPAPEWVVVGGEGGHQSFAPQTELELKVAENLRAAGHYVSEELVCSGSGFEQTLRALAAAMDLPAPDWTPQSAQKAAGEGRPLAVALQQLRANTVMTALGDAVLAANATGGAFVAGGVGVLIAPWLKERTALERFYGRGPRSELMRGVPIRLVRSDVAPLLGAARIWQDWQNRGWW